MSEHSRGHASRPERRREDARSPRQPARRRSRERADRSRSRRARRRRPSRSISKEQEQQRRRREASRDRELRAQRQLQEQEKLREQQERQRAETEPSATVIVSGLPDVGITEERLEAVAWETAVQAGSSMPNGVHFAYDRSTHKFRGFAVVEFPHKEAAKLFKEQTTGLLEVDGFNLALKYHHSASEKSRSRSREHGGRDRDEPSVTLIVKGMATTTTEATVITAFQAFATIKDIRHFPRRGFAFVQFHTVEDAQVAMTHFERDCRGKLDGQRVVVNFAKEREDGRYTGAERNFLQKQALATAEAAAELEKMAAQQVQHENTSKALSGVNAEMWASYMQSVAQTETVQSSNTFEYDKDSGFYLDSKAGLYYDPNSTYFFTTDFKKYFIYDQEEQMLCLVGPEGQKVPDGERRELPSQAKKAQGRVERAEPRAEASTRHAESRPPRSPEPRGRKGDRDRDKGDRDRDKGDRDRDKGDRDRDRRDRREDRDDRGERPPDRSGGGDRRGDSADRGKSRRSGVDQGGARARADQERGGSGIVFAAAEAGPHKPIHFPGGDPLAKLAPASATAASSSQQPAPQPKKKKKPPSDGVLGLAAMPDKSALSHVPGPVTVFKPSAARPGPVTVLVPPPMPASPAAMVRHGPEPCGRQEGVSVGAAAGVTGAAASVAVAPAQASTVATHAFAATPRPSLATAPGPGLAAAALGIAAGAAGMLGEWICEVCMRKFGTEEMLQRHEQLSDLHRENLAKLNAAI